MTLILDKSIDYIGVLMVKKDNYDYPKYKLNDGFHFVHFKNSYINDWIKINTDLEQFNSYKAAEKYFNTEFFDEKLLKEKMLFIKIENEVVGTGTIWYGNHFGKKLDRIHFISIKKDYQGLGLAKALMTKLLDIYSNKSNFLYLTTQTWSYKAINIYKKFGFIPYKGDKPINWKDDNYKENTNKAWDLIDEKIQNYNKTIR